MVNNTTTKVSYQGNGSTTVFSIPFLFTNKSYVKAAIYDSLTDITTVLTSDYYVDAIAKTLTYPGYAPGQEPAEEVQPPVLPSTSKITIYRETELSQLTDLGEKYPLPDIETMSDKLTQIAQEQSEKIDRCVKVDITSTQNPQELINTIYAKTALCVEKATAAGNSAAAAANSQTAAANSASAALASQNAAALSATAAGNSETAAANSATAAGNSQTAAANSASAALASQNAAALSATNAGTSETNAGNSATAAENSATAAGNSETAAANSASAALASQNAAALSATNAGTSETNAGNSATAAENSATAAGNSETAAANSASAALASQNAAALSATNASISETNAGNSATAAGSSATAAANSAAAAAAADARISDRWGLRKPDTIYAADDITYHVQLPTGWYLKCITGGTTSTLDLVITTPIIGDTISDGTVAWEICSIAGGNSSSGGVPVGTMIPYAGNGAIPDGYLACDGSAVGRDTYADLFAVIGTDWGIGDGSTTFNLPNLVDDWVKGSTTAGTALSAGLPNITGTVSNWGIGSSASGAFYTAGQGYSFALSGAASVSNFSASRSSSIYGNSSTVQPKSKTARFIIKY